MAFYASHEKLLPTISSPLLQPPGVTFFTMRFPVVFVFAGTATAVVGCASVLGDFDVQDVNPPSAATADAGATIADAGLIDGQGGSTTIGPGVADSVLYGACLLELANGQVNEVFSFYSHATTSGVQIAFSMQPLRVVGNGPPPTFSSAGLAGLPVGGVGFIGTANAFEIGLGTLTIPSAANPISSSNLVVSSATLRGRYVAGARFCARMTGHLSGPAPRDLDVDKNLCVFVPATDGTPTPRLTAFDFSPGACLY